MNRSMIDAAIAEHGSQTKAARALGISRRTIRKVLAGGEVATKSDAAKPGRALSEFRNEYDKSYIIPRKVRAALATLADGWEYEVPFAKLAGVSLIDLGAVRSEFADAHVIELRGGKRAWAGRRSTADAMRRML